MPCQNGLVLGPGLSGPKPIGLARGLGLLGPKPIGPILGLGLRSPRPIGLALGLGLSDPKPIRLVGPRAEIGLWFGPGLCAFPWASGWAGPTRRAFPPTTGLSPRLTRTRAACFMSARLSCAARAGLSATTPRSSIGGSAGSCTGPSPPHDGQTLGTLAPPSRHERPLPMTCSDEQYTGMKWVLNITWERFYSMLH
jgi:hypothetical protein